MDALGILGTMVDGIAGLIDPAGALAGRPHLLLRAEERFPHQPKLYAREPTIDDGAPIVVVVADEGLVVMGEHDTTTAEWARVLAVTRSEESVTITVRSPEGARVHPFAFERRPEPALLAWLNMPAARFFLALRRALRDRDHRPVAE